MVDADKARFVEVLRWLCRKYQIDGRPRPLPSSLDLADYFEALQDIRIEDLERGSRWHFAHSEFYPTLPAALRRSVEGWREGNPRKESASSSSVPLWMSEECPSCDPDVVTAAMEAVLNAHKTWKRGGDPLSMAEMINIEQHREVS